MRGWNINACSFPDGSSPLVIVMDEPSSRGASAVNPQCQGRRGGGGGARREARGTMPCLATLDTAILYFCVVFVHKNILDKTLYTYLGTYDL